MKKREGVLLFSDRKVWEKVKGGDLKVWGGGQERDRGSWDGESVLVCKEDEAVR